MNYLEELMRIKQRQKEKELQDKATMQSESLTKSNEPKEDDQQHYDHPNTIETKTAIILYIITMIVGSIFIERIYIYIGATMALICFLNRHKLKKKNKK